MVSTKPESTITNLVTDLHFNAPLVGSQRQAQAIYFDLIITPRCGTSLVLLVSLVVM
jgi:hypothetical protein